MLNTPASKYAKKYMCKLIIAFLFCRFLPGACFSYTVSLRVGFENLCMDIIYIYITNVYVSSPNLTAIFSMLNGDFWCRSNSIVSRHGLESGKKSRWKSHTWFILALVCSDSQTLAKEPTKIVVNPQNTGAS